MKFFCCSSFFYSKCRYIIHIFQGLLVRPGPPAALGHVPVPAVPGVQNRRPLSPPLPQPAPTTTPRRTLSGGRSEYRTQVCKRKDSRYLPNISNLGQNICVRNREEIRMSKIYFIKYHWWNSFQEESLIFSGNKSIALTSSRNNPYNLFLGTK